MPATEVLDPGVRVGYKKKIPRTRLVIVKSHGGFTVHDVKMDTSTALGGATSRRPDKERRFLSTADDITAEFNSTVADVAKRSRA